MHCHCGTNNRAPRRTITDPCNQRWGRVPGRSQRLLLGYPHPPRSINNGLALSYVKLLLSSWKTYMCNFEAWFYQQIVGILMGTNFASLIADLFLFCSDMDFMYKQKRSTEGCSKFKSPETIQVQEWLVSTLQQASPKVGQDQVSGGVSVICWHAAPVAYVLWKPCTIR